MLVNCHNEESNLETFVDVVTLTWNNQQLHIKFDEVKNAFKIITEHNMGVFPSSANGILIQDGGK